MKLASILYRILEFVIGMGAGIIIAGSFLAFLCMIGIVPRIAAVTKTMDQARSYENAIVLGAVLANFLYLYQWKIPFGVLLLLPFGFFGGFFVGALAAALAEVLKSMPIFFRRLELRKGVPYLVYSLAAGKMIGSLIQFFYLK